MPPRRHELHRPRHELARSGCRVARSAVGGPDPPLAWPDPAPLPPSPPPSSAVPAFAAPPIDHRTPPTPSLSRRGSSSRTHIARSARGGRDLGGHRRHRSAIPAPDDEVDEKRERRRCPARRRLPARQRARRGGRWGGVRDRRLVPPGRAMREVN